MEDAGPPAAAAATGGDWRSHSQIDPEAREVMVKQIFKTLRWHLPMSDEEGRSRLRKLAEGYEDRFYNEATNKDSYKRKIAMLLIYVENMNQNSHRQEMDWSRMQHKSFGPEDAVEEVHQIHGTGKSFSSKPDDLDEKATEALDEILRKGIDGLEVLDAFGIMDPQHLPKGFFLSDGASYWKQILSDNKAKGIWRPDRGLLGFGIGHHASGYRYFKRTLVYHKDNHKTNLIIVAYSLIHECACIKHEDVVLCHVFQSDNYDPCPNQRPNPFLPRVPNFFDFHKRELDSRMVRLEDLMKNPESFKDFYELDEMYSKCQTNGRNGKRAGVWEHFTPIKVIGPDGEVMLTLAICHGCSMAYLTGKWDSKKGSLSNNGTKTLKEHNRKCSGQYHVAGNP